MQNKRLIWLGMMKGAIVAILACAFFTAFVSCSSSGAGSSDDDSPLQTPVIQSESFNGITFVTISCATPGATIRYTTNGTDPTDSSAVYTDALVIFKTTTVKAVAMKSGLGQTSVATKDFPINIHSHRSIGGLPYVVENGVSTELPLPDDAVSGYTYCLGVNESGDVYVAGTTTEVDGSQTPCCWINGTYHSLSLPADFESGYPAYNISFKNGDYYVLGYSINDGVRIPCYWKNGACVALSVYSSSLGGGIGDGMFIGDDGSVYVTGYVQLSGGVDTPCYWKNGVYVTLNLPAGYEGKSSVINVLGSNIYISGIYYNSSGSDIYNSKPCLWVDGDYSALEGPSLTLAADSTQCGYRTSNIYKKGSDVYVGGYTYQLRGSGKWIMSPVYWKNGSVVTLSLPAYEDVSGGVWSFHEIEGRVVPFGTLTCSDGYGQCYWPNGTCVYGLYSYQ